MELIADVLLASGAFGAAIYCFVLQRRLKKLTQLENGMGGAIAVLSAQVDDLSRALGAAQGAANLSTERLEELTTRADNTATRLELLVSSLHDLPEAEERADPPTERRMRVVRTRSRREPEVAQ